MKANIFLTKTFFVLVIIFFLNTNIVLAESCVSSQDGGFGGIASGITGVCVSSGSSCPGDNYIPTPAKPVCSNNGTCCVLYNADSNSNGAGGSTTSGVSSGSSSSSQSGSTSSSVTSGASNASGGLIPCGRDGQNKCNLCYFVVGFQGLINFGLRIVVYLALAGMFAAGVMYILAFTDEGMAKKGKEILAGTLKGFVFVVTAWLIINITLWVLNANVSLGQDKSKKWYEISCSRTD